MEEQLRLFDPTDYKGMDGYNYIEVDLDEDTLKWYQDEAKKRNITFDEMINSDIKTMIYNLTCPTCKKYCGNEGKCPYCGELDN